MNLPPESTLLKEDRRDDRRGGRRGKQLLDEIKEAKKNFRNSKEQALDRALWRNHFARGCGLVVRQTALRTQNL
jgi:hypothetical protein